MQKETWRHRWLSSINELTSLNLQIDSWLDTEQSNPHWSFVEFMCSYFDDLLSDNDYNHFIGIGWVTNQEYEVIENWHSALMNYKAPADDDHNREAILNDLIWIKIVELGENSRKKLTAIVSETESKILEEKINYRNYI